MPDCAYSESQAMHRPLLKSVPVFCKHASVDGRRVPFFGFFVRDPGSRFHGVAIADLAPSVAVLGADLVGKASLVYRLRALPGNLCRGAGGND